MTDTTTTTTTGPTGPTGKTGAPDIVTCVLSYLLGPIPLLTKKDDPFVQWHAKQGTALLIAWVLIAVVSGVLAGVVGLFGTLGFLLNVVLLVVAVVGILKMSKGEKWEVPVLGPLAHKNL